MESKSDQILILTEMAEAQISRLLSRQKSENEEIYLRVSVQAGGCAGLSYKLAASKTIEPHDRIQVLTSGIKILIDVKSSLYLQGVTIDYDDGFEGTGFIFKNAAASKSCACGSSFAV